MIFKNLLRRKTRTLFTLFGIGIGVAAVVALGAMAEGFINSYSTVLTSSGADLILTQKDASDIIFSSVDESVGQEVATMPGVKQVAGVMLGLVTTSDLPYFFVFGVGPDEFALRHYKIVQGAETISGSHQMFLGKAAAKNAKRKVGDSFKIQDVSYKIAGLYETGEGIEEWGAVISLKDAQDEFRRPRQVSFYQIKVQKPELTDQLIKDLEKRYPKLTTSRSANFMEEQQETGIIRAFGWFIGMLAVMAGGLGMMNTMLMSVFERTREIGVLRAVGWRRRRVLFLILGEAFTLSVFGGILGNMLGFLMLEGITQIPGVAAFLENAYSPNLFVQSMIIALFLGAVGGLYPAWRAASLQPVEAMRYEGTGSRSRQVGAQHAVANHHVGDFTSPLEPSIARDDLRAPLRTLLASILERWDVRLELVRKTFAGRVGVGLRNVFRQRTRAVLTTLGIGLGVGLVVALGGMADGFVSQLSAMGNKGGELTISEAKASDMSLAKVDEKIGRWAASLPAVENVSGMLMNVSTVAGSAYFLTFGRDPTSYAIRHFTITEGERLESPREVIIGKVAARNLKKQVGDTLRISGSTYRIVGIYETGVSYEEGGGVISLKEAQALFRKPNQVSLFYVKLKDTNQANTVRQQIEERWPQVTVSNSSEYAEKTNDIKNFRIEVAALSFISILVGGIGIMNAMLMSVYERTREIGTLRALGWRRRRVVMMILRESLELSLLSGLAGIALGMGLGWVVSLSPDLGAFLKASYSIQLFAQAMFIALFLGGIGALYPAWRAANLSPIEALRYE